MNAWSFFKLQRIRIDFYFSIHVEIIFYPFPNPFHMAFPITPIVTRSDKFSWSDEVWLAKRKIVGDSARPINIYEAHLPY